MRDAERGGDGDAERGGDGDAVHYLDKYNGVENAAGYLNMLPYDHEESTAELAK